MRGGDAVELAYRENVLRRLAERYGTEPEHLWAKYPTYAAFRRQNNQKWFAALMNVPRCKLGLEGDTPVDILNSNAILYCPVLCGRAGDFCRPTT